MKYIYAIILWFSVTSVSPALAETSEKPSYIDALMFAASEVLVETVLSTLIESPDDGAAISVVEEPTVDPLEKYNRMMFRFNQVLDEHALQPIATKYREYTPVLVQTGVSNFFSNIGDVGVVTNSVLQGKLDQAVDDSTRLLINTIAGVGGVIDVATKLNYEKNNEDFGQTFGVWGVPEGPYIVLPVLGPRTLRSAVGTALDTYLQVEALGTVGEAASGTDLVSEMLALNLVNKRSQLLGQTELLEQASLDPYIFAREAYLAYRRCQVDDCDKIDYSPATEELGNASEFSGPDELDLLDELE